MSRKWRAMAKVHQVVATCRMSGAYEYEGDRLPDWGDWKVSTVMRKARTWAWYEERQKPEVWEAWAKWPAEGGVRRFAWEVLWKKLPVAARLKKCKVVKEEECVWRDGREDVLHAVKGCVCLRDWFQLVSAMVGDLGRVEASRLITDTPVESFRTLQGALVWAGVWHRWKRRCDAVFREGEASSRWVLQAAAYIRGREWSK
eukprot:NODE_3978_length_885_cov_19.771531_g3666_i0.p1 GENE.NODE_3978_length_885_cov_19.771531_g3666_i0~~NODE_3978_length_885_cov_19.771531_g3666_i0.p1  ORF type:complete len:201 (+),score=12.44 NODE_3978_length_885_cov_19.771531_g3666_i0:202-804(+)